MARNASLHEVCVWSFNVCHEIQLGGAFSVFKSLDEMLHVAPNKTEPFAPPQPSLREKRQFRTLESGIMVSFLCPLPPGYLLGCPRGKRTERGEEPSVLAAGVAVLQDLLDGLLGILALADLLEGIRRDDALEALELKSVTGGHKVVVVDDLDERLDLAALLLSRLGHATSDLGGVPLNAGYEGMAVRVCLAAGIDGLDDDDLEAREELSANRSFRRFFGVSQSSRNLSVLCFLRRFPLPKILDVPPLSMSSASRQFHRS